MTLAGCGGGDTPTPAPIPIPTPTPTPTPAPAFPTLTDDLATGATYQTTSTGTGGFWGFGGSQPNPPATFAPTVIAYDAPSKTYTVTGSDSVQYGGAVGVFGPANLVSTNPDYTTYDTRKSGLGSTLRLLTPGTANPVVAVNYVGYGYVTTTVTNPAPPPGAGPTILDAQYFTYGNPTLQANTPTAGTITYQGVVGGSYTTNASGTPQDYSVNGTFSVTADFAAAKSVTTLDLTATSTTQPTLAFHFVTTIGSIGSIVSGQDPRFHSGGTAIGAFHGDFSDPANVHLSGPVLGYFFGPKGTEVGISFHLTVNGNDTLQGVGVGH